MTADARTTAAFVNGGDDTTAAGVLVYPEVPPIPTLQYDYGPHRLAAPGIDRTQDWNAIHLRLMDLVATV